MTITPPQVPAYRAADLMEKTGPHVPKLYGSRALYKVQGLPRGLVDDGALIPSWNWTNPHKAVDGSHVVQFDCTAAFVAAATSANYVHGAYVRAGGNRFSDSGPGYYKTRVQPWTVAGIPNPLGTHDLEVGSWVWVTRDTLENLEIACEKWGFWKSVDVSECYLAAPLMKNGRPTDKPGSGRLLRKWGERVRDDRKAVQERLNRDPADEAARAEYKAIKDGYSMAIQMWNTPYDPPNTPFQDRKKKNETFRPDWYDTLLSAHAANMWRRVFNAGLPPYSCTGVALGDRDAMTFLEPDARELIGHSSPPFRYDPAGLSPGSFKVKRTYFLGTCGDVCTTHGHVHGCTLDPGHDTDHHADTCAWEMKKKGHANA